jgi:glycosyltransferase involved in cell wall biosynthesis
MAVGGAERVVAMLVAALANRGHEVSLVAPPGMRDADLLGIPHLRLALSDDGRALGGAAQGALRLASIIRRVRPDVVHAQNVKSAALAGVSARLARPGGRPGVLATFHGVTPQEYPRAARLLRLADHVACVSDDLCERIVSAGLPGNRVSLVRNAVELFAPLDATRRESLDAEFGLTEDTPIVAIVGRLVPQKAHARFVEAARVAAQSRPDLRFLVVGDGPLRAEIEARVERAGLAGQVVLTGDRPDARDIIARADVLAFSSDWEGLSIAALEGLAAGTPVLSTDVEGMRELVAGGGAAVVPRDEGGALGARLLELFNDPLERQRMGEAGRAMIAQEFSLETMIDGYERLYRTVAQRG